MRLFNYILILVCSVHFTVALGQVPAPGKKQSTKILVINGTAHIGNGTVIENAVLGFYKGKITVIGPASEAKVNKNEYDQIIDAEGQHIYPGIIAPNATLGLVEIDAVKATEDFRDVGRFKPHVRSIVAYNAESEITSTVRTNGVLMGQITPRGGFITGTSSVVQFDAWNWEDAVVKIDDGIHMNWPKTFMRQGWWAEPGGVKKNEKCEAQKIELKQFFIEAKAYSTVPDYGVKNLRYEASRGLFDGSKNLYIHCHFVKDIMEAVQFKRALGIEKMVIVGGYDSWMVAEMLKENNIPVMVGRTHDLPKREDDDIDNPYKLAARLHDAGVLYCLENSGDMEAMNSRNIPFLAGTTVAYGLNKEQALQSITLNTAKILGLDNELGSLEQGKLATFFISKGDALDMMTNDVTTIFIEGRSVSLRNHQLDLYDKYQSKYAK